MSKEVDTSSSGNAMGRSGRPVVANWSLGMERT